MEAVDLYPDAVGAELQVGVGESLPRRWRAKVREPHGDRRVYLTADIDGGERRRLLHTLATEMLDAEPCERQLDLASAGPVAAGNVKGGEHQCAAAATLAIEWVKRERQQLAVGQPGAVGVVRIAVITERQRPEAGSAFCERLLASMGARVEHTAHLRSNGDQAELGVVIEEIQWRDDRLGATGRQERHECLLAVPETRQELRPIGAGMWTNGAGFVAVERLHQEAVSS